MENPVGCTGEGKRSKGNIGEGLRESKTGTVFELSLEVRNDCHFDLLFSETDQFDMFPCLFYM